MLIDTHSHLHFSGYDQDRSEVQARMAEYGVKTITVGTTMTTSRSAVAYAEKYADAWAAVGYHPDHVTNEHVDEEEGNALAEPFDSVELEKMVLSSTRVLALGETGLDYHYFENISDEEIAIAKQEQLRVFIEHVRIAAKHDKTLIIHSRDATTDMLAALTDVKRHDPQLRIVMHAFCGPWQEASDLLDLGCWLGIGGIITFKPRKGTAPEDTLEAVVRRTPNDRLLLETDAPWLAPVPVRGTRNEPSNVRHVAEHVARVLGLSYEQVTSITTENARRCFNSTF